MRRLIKVFTVCFQEFQLQIEQKWKKKKYTWHPWNDKWAHLMYKEGKSIRLIWVDAESAIQKSVLQLMIFDLAKLLIKRQ